MSKIDRTVVRNQAYRKQGISIRERHNERKNIHYSNPDIVPERSQLNVHFKRCKGTYAQAVDILVLKDSMCLFAILLFCLAVPYSAPHRIFISEYTIKQAVFYEFQPNLCQAYQFRDII